MKRFISVATLFSESDFDKAGIKTISWFVINVKDAAISEVSAFGKRSLPIATCCVLKY